MTTTADCQLKVERHTLLSILDHVMLMVLVLFFDVRPKRALTTIKFYVHLNTHCLIHEIDPLPTSVILQVRLFVRYLAITVSANYLVDDCDLSREEGSSGVMGKTLDHNDFDRPIFSTSISLSMLGQTHTKQLATKAIPFDPQNHLSPSW